MGGGLHVVMRSEATLNTCFVTAEIGLVTLSSVHVNEGHGRGIILKFTGVIASTIYGVLH